VHVPTARELHGAAGVNNAKQKQIENGTTHGAVGRAEEAGRDRQLEGSLSSAELRV
jgi:hypothetical protein